MYKRIIMVSAALLGALAMSASAQIGVRSVDQAGFDKLSEVDKAEILQNIAKKANNDPLAAAAKAAPTVEKAEQWVNLGTRVGQMMGGAAKEVGVQVNEFSKTPVGMLTMAIIVWKLMGAAIVHIVAGFLFAVVGIVMVTRVFKRYSGVQIKYNADVKNVFGNHPVLSKSYGSLSADALAGQLVCYGIVFVVSMIIIFTF